MAHGEVSKNCSLHIQYISWAVWSPDGSIACSTYSVSRAVCSGLAGDTDWLYLNKLMLSNNSPPNILRPICKL